MSEQTDQCGEYLHASERKIEIARYHLEQLRSFPPEASHDAEPSIRVQAHFEGVLYAFVAATDQVAEAISHRFGRDRPHPSLLTAINRVSNPHLQEQLKRWLEEPIASDLHQIRVLATHHHYFKGQFEVPPPPGPILYRGSRALDDYCAAAVDHLDSFSLLIEELRGTLNARTIR